MKQLITITTLGALLLLAACKKNDGTATNTSDNATAKLIVGTWGLIKIHTKVSTLANVPKVDTTVLYDPKRLIGDLFIINADGTAYIVTPKKIRISNGTYKLIADTNSWLKYRISGKNILISQQGETDEYSNDIVTLNSTSLQLHNQYSGLGSSDFNLNFTTMYNFDEQTYYTKQ